MIMQERLYVTEDRQTAVQEGDKRAAFLLIGKGQEVAKVIAEKYGIEDGRLKQKKKAANKQAEKPPNKSGLVINRKEKNDG